MDFNLKNHLDFTILLPVYDRDDLCNNFEKVIESIYSNSIKPDNLFVLVDGNLNNNFNIKINICQKKFNFKVIRSEKIGLAKILNKGIQEVKTFWIGRMDGDDLCEIDRFKNSIKYMKEDYDLFGGQIIEIDNFNEKNKKKVPINENDIKKIIKYRNPFNHMTVFYKTKIVKKLGGYPNLYLKEDYGLWCKMIGSGAKVANMPFVVVKAKTGNNFFIRRGGLKYIVSEFYLQKILLENKLTNLFFATLIFILKSIVYILPVNFKKFIYKKLLRK